MEQNKGQYIFYNRNFNNGLGVLIKLS